MASQNNQDNSEHQNIRYYQDSPDAPSSRRRGEHQRLQPSLHALPNIPLTENFPSYHASGFTRQNLTDGGATGITEHKGSPPVEGIDHNSNETHSSGEVTKIDPRSPSGHRAVHPHGKDNFESGYGTYHREVNGQSIRLHMYLMQWHWESFDHKLIQILQLRSPHPG